MSNKTWEQLKHLLQGMPDRAIRQLLWARATNVDSLFQRGAVVIWVGQVQDEAGQRQESQFWQLEFVEAKQIARLGLPPERTAELVGMISSYQSGQEVVIVAVNETPVPDEYIVGISTVEIPEAERWY